MKFVVLSQPNCKYCQKSIDLLDNYSLEFEVININDNPLMKTLMSLADLKTVPQIFKSNGRHVGGFSDLKASLGQT